MFNSVHHNTNTDTAVILIPNAGMPMTRTESAQSALSGVALSIWNPLPHQLAKYVHRCQCLSIYDYMALYKSFIIIR